MIVFAGIYSGGGSRPRLSISRTAIPAGQTGVIAQLRSSLKAPLVFSRLSGSNVTVAADGAVSFTTGLGDGATRLLVARVQGDGSAVAEREFTFSGVAGVVVAPTLAALSLSGSAFSVGTPLTVDIAGATAGSVITLTSPVAGFSVNSAARQLVWDGAGSTGSPDITLRETLADATNSPRDTVAGVTVSAGGEGVAYLSSVSIEANGWVLRVDGTWPASTFASINLDPNGAPRVAIATTSAGFSRSGSTAVADPARVRGGVVGTRPLRRPWPDHLLLDEVDLGGGVRRVRLALSRYVYPGDAVSVTFASGWRAGLGAQTVVATNSSTHAVRLPSARWATPQYLHETGAFRIDLLVANIETENLSAAAAVRVIGYDGTNTQSWWLTESVSDRFGDNLKCWGATITPSGLTPGIITLHWEVYPWVGAMRTSGAAHVVDTEAGFSVSADAPLHVCWDAGGARYGGHHVYVDPAGTLTPSLVTVGATLAIAKAGTRAANNFVAMQALENLSRALPAANGYPAVIARTLEGATITFSPGVHTVAYGNLLTSARTVEARLVLQGDPDDPDPRNNVIWRTDTGTGNVRVTRMLFRNMSIELGGTWPGLSWRSHFDNVTLRGRAGNETATVGITSSVTVGFFRLSFTRSRYWRYGLNLGGSTMATGLARNLEFIRNLTTPVVVASTRIADATVPVGSSGMVGGGLGGLTDSFIWGVRSFAQDNTGFSFPLFSGAGTPASPSRHVRGNVVNCLFERPNNGSAFMNDAFFLSAGNQEFVDCLVEGSTFVGQRVNWGYNDPTDAATNMVSIGNAVRNSFFDRRACKHDIFTMNGNLIAGWSNLYAVNEEANVQVDRADWTGSDGFAREFEGLRSIYIQGQANNPDAAGNFIFANDASRLSLQGSVLGHGNYLPGPTSVVLGRGRRASIDTDVAGVVRPSAFDSGLMELV